MWYCSVFTQYSYYCDLFCSGQILRIRYFHSNGWVRYIDTKKIKFWCMSSLLLSIDLQWSCYFRYFCIKLTNGAMVRWCNGKIKISIGRLFSQKYRICSFCFIFEHNFFAAEKVIHNLQFCYLTTSTATKCMLSNQATTEIRVFVRGRTIVVRDIVNLI